MSRPLSTRRGGRRYRAVVTELRMTQRTLRETEREGRELEALNQKLAADNLRLELALKQSRKIEG